MVIRVISTYDYHISTETMNIVIKNQGEMFKGTSGI